MCPIRRPRPMERRIPPLQAPTTYLKAPPLEAPSVVEAPSVGEAPSVEVAPSVEEAPFAAVAPSVGEAPCVAEVPRPLAPGWVLDSKQRRQMQVRQLVVAPHEEEATASTAVAGAVLARVVSALALVLVPPEED